MLSYQHGYHAGGPADLHKHFALAGLLTLLIENAEPLRYVETHAGAGVYDLSDAQASKTGEAARGIARIERTDHPFWTAAEAVRAYFGEMAYPGSPAVARSLLRKRDRILLNELHPAEHARLSTSLAGPRVTIRRQDGHEAALKAALPGPMKIFMLIDPSYEVKSEYAQTAGTALTAAARWPRGLVMVWYPILPDGRHATLSDSVERGAPAGLIRDEALFREQPERGMIGSGLLLLNPPRGAAEMLRAARQAVAPALL